MSTCTCIYTYIQNKDKKKKQYFFYPHVRIWSCHNELKIWPMHRHHSILKPFKSLTVHLSMRKKIDKDSTQGNVHARLEYHEYWESNLYINISYNFINLSQGLVQTRSGGKKRGFLLWVQTRPEVCVWGGGEEGLEFKYLYKTKNFWILTTIPFDFCIHVNIYCMGNFLFRPLIRDGLEH